MKKFFKSEYIIIAFLSLIVLVGGGISFSNGNLAGSKTVAPQSYSAVFLANDQVYFGKLGKSSRDYTILTDVYYPQAQAKQQSGGKVTAESPKVTLIKLGDEIQGPKDEIKINTNQVLYIEELKEDGLVVKKIRDSKK